MLGRATEFNVAWLPTLSMNDTLTVSKMSCLMSGRLDLPRANGVMHGDVALESDPHRHEDRGAHRDELRRVQQVWEELQVQGGLEVENALEELQDAAEEVPRVEADQRDQQQVKAVPHLVPTAQDCVEEQHIEPVLYASLILWGCQEHSILKLSSVLAICNKTSLSMASQLMSKTKREQYLMFEALLSRAFRVTLCQPSVSFLSSLQEELTKPSN